LGNSDFAVYNRRPLPTLDPVTALVVEIRWTHYEAMSSPNLPDGTATRSPRVRKHGRREPSGQSVRN
jgi:hypothetical protein